MGESQTTKWLRWGSQGKGEMIIQVSLGISGCFYLCVIQLVRSVFTILVRTFFPEDYMVVRTSSTKYNALIGLNHNILGQRYVTSKSAINRYFPCC